MCGFNFCRRKLKHKGHKTDQIGVRMIQRSFVRISLRVMYLLSLIVYVSSIILRTYRRCKHGSNLYSENLLGEWVEWVKLQQMILGFKSEKSNLKDQPQVGRPAKLAFGGLEGYAWESRSSTTACCLLWNITLVTSQAAFVGRLVRADVLPYWETQPMLDSWDGRWVQQTRGRCQ